MVPKIKRLKLIFLSSDDMGYSWWNHLGLQMELFSPHPSIHMLKF